MLLVSLLLITFIPTTTADVTCEEDCSGVQCINPTNCKGGIVKKWCECCATCAKVEGEECGGYLNDKGRCDVGLICVIDKDSGDTASGFCRKVGSLCDNKKCGFRQQCAVTKHNKPVCICPRNCRESKLRPLCGYKNGKQYKNTCELQRHECRSGKEIGFYKGLCKKCYHEGKSYRVKESRKGDAPCETCNCLHGKWICKTKKSCQETLDFCTVFNDRSTGITTSTCPRGFICKVQIPSIPEQNIPGVGKCVPGNSTVSTSAYKNVTTTPTSNTAKTVVNVCELPVKTGSCRQSISRWYFNTDRKKCVKFTFGGCDGNANNFRTKSSCRNTCMRRRGQKSTVSTPPKRNIKPTRTVRPTNTTDICQLPPAPGPCRAAMPQWYYNPKKQRCSRFIYGGCGGNDNNFNSKDDCKAACMRNKGIKRITPDDTRLSSESLPTSIATSSTRKNPTTREYSTGPTLKPTRTPSTRRSKTTTRSSTTTKRSWRARKSFRCPCSDCKRQTGKATCKTRHGCFTSRVKDADGLVTFNYGCLENEQHYILLCNVREPDKRHPNKVLECCKGHMCNLNDVNQGLNQVVNHPVNDRLRGRTDLLRTLPKSTPTQNPTLQKQSSSPGEPRCYDGHSKKFFGETEEWKPNDCTVCSCLSGEPTCVATVCKHPQCLNPIRIQGQCCPVCDNNGNITEDSQEMIKALAQSQLTKVLVSIKKPKDQRFCEDLNTGELYLSGQNWKVDDCTTCYCQRDGKIACAVQMCSGYPGCPNPVKEKGQCCPVCKDDIDALLTYPEKEVIDSPDSCLDSVTGDYYRHSEMWQQDDCTACICGADRKYQCRKTTCEELACAEKVNLKGRCCPSCASDTKAGCSFEGQKFLQGEYKLLADHCTLCECRNMEWICSSRRCRKDDKPAL